MSCLYYLPAETQEARKLPLNNGYTSKVRVHDRYEVVGFISSGTYGKVYKAVGVKGQSGEFAIKKCVQIPHSHRVVESNVLYVGSNPTRKGRPSSTLAYLSQLSVRWLFALNCLTRT